MEDIVEFVKSLGGLHDSTVLKLLWLPKERRLEIDIKDIYWNFEGLPDYSGPTTATFVFSQVADLVVDVDFTTRGHMICDWLFQAAGVPSYKSELLFSPSGKITVECGSIECVKDSDTQAARVDFS